ncbi:MAG: hypothetical protein JWQ38_869 [Flavipsychrobacter sp.]|nr:hypothetical protein [Flavipsychrobacter sp.]
MKQKKDDIVYLELINKGIERILGYIGDADEEVFLRDNMMKDACLMQLVVIGESGGKVSEENKNRFKEVEWQLMKAARNFFAHAYEHTDWVRVYDTIKTILPDLKPRIEHIIEVLEKENNGKIN